MPATVAHRVRVPTIDLTARKAARPRHRASVASRPVRMVPRRAVHEMYLRPVRTEKLTRVPARRAPLWGRTVVQSAAPKDHGLLRVRRARHHQAGRVLSPRAGPRNP